MRKNNFVSRAECLSKIAIRFACRLVFCDIRPIRNHQLVSLAPIDKQVGLSQELHRIFKHGFIGNHFRVVAAAIQGNVDCVDYISHSISPRVVFTNPAPYSSYVSVVRLTGKWRTMSEKGQSRKSMLAVKNMEELRRLYDTDAPVLAYAFKRQTDEGWTPEHSHQRGQLVALTHGLLIVETESQRRMFPSGRCAWTPPNCKH